MLPQLPNLRVAEALTGTSTTATGLSWGTSTPHLNDRDSRYTLSPITSIASGASLPSANIQSKPTQSKRARSFNSFRGSRREHRASKALPTPISPSSSTPRSSISSTSHSSLSGRANSAPALPAIGTTEVFEDDDFDAYSLQDSFSIRDSVSIRDDPFFRNYQSPHLVSLGRELRSATHMNYYPGEDDLPEEPPPRSNRRPHPEAINSVNLPPQSRSGMADINIAVIGSVGVGKSTLIQRALGLRSLPTSIASSTRMSVENVVYTTTLIELDRESFDINPDRKIQWPKQINGLIVPQIDGALLLYDVMNRESIAELPQTLNALESSSLPTILVSCKCDNPENTRQISVENIEAACVSVTEAVKFASNVPESARHCLSSMLSAIMHNRTANSIEPSGPRRRATSTANLEKPSDPSMTRPLSQNSKHSRASSEYSVRGLSQPPIPIRGQPSLSRSNGRTNLYQNSSFDPHEAPPLSSPSSFRPEKFQDHFLDPKITPGHRSRSPMVSPTSIKTADNSFLDLEESDADSTYRYSDDIPILQRNDDSFFDKPAKVAGVTFDDLVDRLLGQNMSRADNNFSDIFLCLYRKFAAPGELFSAILTRLDRISEDKSLQYLTRTATQLRIVTVVAKWVSAYPGDFASASTSGKFDVFITSLAADPVFAAAAQDMRMQLQSRVVEDDDTGWARTDADVDSENGVQSVPPSPMQSRTFPRQFEDDLKKLTVDEDQSSGSIERNGSQAGSTLYEGLEASDDSVSLSFHTVEDYEREAATMVPRTNLPLTKFRYHIFMDTSDDDFADEMTRIDWVMFSSIRLRDLVRHVSLSLEQRGKCKSLYNVERMVSHFNHIAKWVANMILIRDKAKHRAQMLEKFMTIALKLRLLNNYNGLAAVLAGINGTAIHRLAQTRALVSPDTQKRFARLVLLMSTQKSHFAYRLAWENSPLPRIPFIPLHRRDLVSAEEGSRTFVGANGDRINWKKFEVLSEVILPIMKSQVVPYPNLARHENARELILDCKMPTDDEDIYQRSLAIESASSSSSAVDFGKKKFPWFQKDKY